MTKPIVLSLLALSFCGTVGAVSPLISTVQYNTPAANVTAGVTGATIALNLSTFTASTTNYLVIGISNQGIISGPDPGQSVSGITWNGSSTGMTLLCHAFHNSSQNSGFSNSTDAEIWYLQNPAAVSSNLVVTLTGNAVLEVGAVVYSGVASLGTCGSANVAGGNGTTVTSAGMTASASGGVAFDTLSVKTTASSMAIMPTSPQTQLSLGTNTGVPGNTSSCPSGANCSVGGATSDAFGAVSSMGQTFTGPSNAAYVAVAFNPPALSASMPVIY